MRSLFDSHCHLDFAEFSARRSAVFERARAAGVRHVLVPGVGLDQWKRAYRLRTELERDKASGSLPTDQMRRLSEGTIDPQAVGEVDVRFAIGLHPEQPLSVDAITLEDWIDRIEAVAVGEFGWHRSHSDAGDALVDTQLEIAAARGLPVILHIVGVHGHALSRLARHRPVRGVVHSYSGSPELISRYLELGLSISFGPSILRTNSRKWREAARRVPIDRLLVETDGPDQRVEPSSDSRGPEELVAVLDTLQEARAESVETLAERTCQNALALFSPQAA